MAKRVVDESSLTVVADAIRERCGTTDAMEFPNGFASTVKGIPDYFTMRMGNQVLQEYRNDTLTYIYKHSFNGWLNLKGAHFPALEIVDEYGMANCGVVKFDFPKLHTIKANAFSWGVTETMILRVNSVCTLENASALGNCPIARGTGYIYVPKALVDSYKSATNWSTYANQIRAIEDYPEITGG